MLTGDLYQKGFCDISYSASQAPSRAQSAPELGKVDESDLISDYEDERSLLDAAYLRGQLSTLALKQEREARWLRLSKYSARKKHMSSQDLEQAEIEMMRQRVRRSRIRNERNWRRVRVEQYISARTAVSTKAPTTPVAAKGGSQTAVRSLRTPDKTAKASCGMPSVPPLPGGRMQSVHPFKQSPPQPRPGYTGRLRSCTLHRRQQIEELRLDARSRRLEESSAAVRWQLDATGEDNTLSSTSCWKFHCRAAVRAAGKDRE